MTLFFWLLIFTFPPHASHADTGEEQRISQIFSPGDLTSVHSELDSLRNCAQCHANENQIEAESCLECHTTVKSRIKARAGYHGGIAVRNKNCESCHYEHQGKDAPTIQWPRNQKKFFPHAQSGWPLQGAHREEGCADCHETRRIVDTKILSLLKKFPRKETYLGLEDTCTTCHFDEHRGELGDDCLSCHTQSDFSPASGFDHNKHYTLKGAHKKVECKECHAEVEDTQNTKAQFPKPKELAYLTYDDIPHETCIDCHQDPHQGRLGGDCLDCHTNDSWAADQVKDKLAFHNTTRYPLEGKHRQVKCQSCHPTIRGKKKLRNIAFEACTDCHPNAHPDLPLKEMTEGCEGCHTVNGFKPSTYSMDDHASTVFPLEGAHDTVGCQECHLEALGQAHKAPKRPKRLRGKMARQKISTWLFASKNDPKDCSTCHTSPHREQFENKGCESCHSVDSWEANTNFDHTKQSDYPLDGEHQETDCALCHSSENDEQGAFTRYKPLEYKSCTPCHDDIHYGQFSDIDAPLACEDCHLTEGFDSLRFDHNSPFYSDYPLKGGHKNADCSACHLTVSLTEKVELTTFRPIPTACALCHEDNHNGAYKEAGKLVSSLKDDAPKPTPLPWDLPQNWDNGHGGDTTNCASCHVEERWSLMRFDHNLTQFPLKGGHTQTDCVACHTGAKAETPPTDCADCHQDIHRGTLGSSCQDCHTEQSFSRPENMLARHMQSSFPLTGQHAVVPCTECHADVRDLGYANAPSQCASCHLPQAQNLGNTGLDHSTLTDCAQCHTPLAWKNGALVDHERCFPIRPGSEHAQFTCQECHTSGVPQTVNFCDSGTASCINCHGCEQGEHQGVRGYECQDQKCYSCHPGGDD